MQILAHGDKGKFDPAAGVAELRKVGTQMKQGEALMVIHYNDEKRLKEAMDYFKAAYRLAPKRPTRFHSWSAGCLISSSPEFKKPNKKSLQ